MKQTRLMSLIEALANVTVGYGVAVVAQMLVFPLFGLDASLAQNLGIGAAFTGVSLIRSYALRRVFEALRVRSSQGDLAEPAFHPDFDRAEAVGQMRTSRSLTEGSFARRIRMTGGGPRPNPGVGGSMRRISP